MPHKDLEVRKAYHREYNKKWNVENRRKKNDSSCGRITGLRAGEQEEKGKWLGRLSDEALERIEREGVRRRVGSYFTEEDVMSKIESVKKYEKGVKIMVKFGLDEVIKKGQAIYETPDQLAESMLGFEDWCLENSLPYTYSALALYLRCSKETIIRMEKLPNFRAVLAPVIETMDLVNAIKGEQAKNPSWYIFSARNRFGGVERYEDKSTTVLQAGSAIESLSDEELTKQIDGI